MGKYTKLGEGEVWCPYCDEYKILKKDLPESLIDEFLEDLIQEKKWIEADHYTILPLVERHIKKWEKRREKNEKKI